MNSDEPVPVAAPAHLPRRRRGPLLVLACLAAVVYATDQVTKWLAVEHLTGREPVPVLGEVLQLRLLYNPGAAFSLGTNVTWLLTLLAVVVVAIILRVAVRLASRGWGVALGLLLGGALGNLTDRLLREPGFARGHVVDFLELPRWPVFNVADSAICLAAAVVVVLSLRGIGVDGRRDDSSARRVPAGTDA